MKLNLEPEDARHFTVGRVVVIEHGIVLRGWRLRLYVVRHHLRRCTRWWRPRTVVTAVDVEAGVVALVTERWSWRRWRWERVS